MSKIELSRQHADGHADEIAVVHSNGGDDGPVQIISLTLLEHYRQCERNLLALLGELFALQKYSKTDPKSED